MALTHSDSIGELAGALASIQRKLTPATKDATRDGRPYATLESVWQSCRKLLAARGIAVVQSPDTTWMENGTARVGVTTMLIMDTADASSGEWIADDGFGLTCRLDRDDELAAITIARKYALAAMVGVTWQEEPAQARGEVVSMSPDELDGYQRLSNAATSGTVALTSCFNAMPSRLRVAIVARQDLWNDVKSSAEIADEAMR